MGFWKESTKFPLNRQSLPLIYQLARSEALPIPPPITLVFSYFRCRRKCEPQQKRETNRKIKLSARVSATLIICMTLSSPSKEIPASARLL